MGMPNQGYYFFSISRGANDYNINLDNWTTGRKWFMKKSAGAQPVTADWNDITIGAGFLPQTEDARTIAGYRRVYLPNNKELVVDFSPDLQISTINRSEASTANAQVLFNGTIYTIPAGGGTISTSTDAFSWEDGGTAPGLGNNARAFVRNNKIVLVSTNVDTAGVAGNAGDIFPSYESSDGENWTLLGVPTGTKALTTVCLTNTGRLIACCNDGSESTISDDGAATWTAGTALPAPTEGGGYNFSCQITNNPNFPTRICFVTTKAYNVAPSNTGDLRVSYSDDNGDTWTRGPNAPGSYKQGQCVHIKSNGTLWSVNVVSNSPQGKSVDGGASWTTTAGSGQSNTTNPQGMWIDDGTTWGIMLLKNGNATTTRKSTDGGASWSNGLSIPNSSPQWNGPDNNSILIKGATVKFLSGAVTWLFSTEKVLLIDPPSDYINTSDFKALVSASADWAAFQAAIAAL
ncbi:hypothetical protein AGMMS49944_08960 [Spirochaetia bacterium]|nr:hypothetical protein AGMMS49944_08960 [Spirochaetia bacterium]